MGKGERLERELVRGSKCAMEVEECFGRIEKKWRRNTGGWLVVWKGVRNEDISN